MQPFKKVNMILFSIRIYSICIARRISHELVLEAAPNKNIGWRRDNFRRHWISSYCAIYLPNLNRTSKEEETLALSGASVESRGPVIWVHDSSSPILSSPVFHPLAFSSLTRPLKCFLFQFSK